MRVLPPPRPRAELFGWAVLVLVSTVAFLRVWPSQSPFPLNLFEAYAAWALLPAWPVAVVAAHRRRWALASIAALLALVHAAWVLEDAPRYGGARPCHEEERPLRLVTANLLAPRPSPPFADELGAMEADVLVMSELSTGWEALLRDHGVLAPLPHLRAEVIDARESYFGIGIASRFPIVDHAIDHVEDTPRARVDLDVHGTLVRIYGVHTHPPTSTGALAVWRHQMDDMITQVRADRAAGRVVIVTGDLNTTTMTRGYRELLDAGLTSAYDVVARPFAVTWPNGLFWFPPMRIDHVLVSGLAVRSVREGVGEGSDHRPIVTELCVPAAGRSIAR